MSTSFSFPSKNQINAQGAATENPGNWLMARASPGSLWLRYRVDQTNAGSDITRGTQHLQGLLNHYMQNFYPLSLFLTKISRLVEIVKLHDFCHIFNES